MFKFEVLDIKCLGCGTPLDCKDVDLTKPGYHSTECKWCDTPNIIHLYDNGRSNRSTKRERRSTSERRSTRERRREKVTVID